MVSLVFFYNSQDFAINLCILYFRVFLFFFKDKFFSFTDVSAPVFSNCPSNIVATADRGTISTQVTWSSPSATDNSGLILNITHYGKQPGDLFLAGEHNIRYLASDQTGNVAECKFKVFVSGNLHMTHAELCTNSVIGNI